MNEIKIKCDEILLVNMWYNLDESFFWPIMELIDLDDDSLIKIYSTIEEKYLKILYHETVIVPVVESTQCEKFVDYIKSASNNKSNFIDDILVNDLESALFINYEEPNSPTKIKYFSRVYSKLKRIIKNDQDKPWNEKRVKEILNQIVIISSENKSEYFTYIQVYWLSIYFNQYRKFSSDINSIELYKKKLSDIFPCARL
ncbi:TPA: hypothetical protein ACKRXP_001474 [Proteus mirabilis]|uniref:hypothetical protein n=1 Tax=Proteus mirabilis TaxID=584 RepID=UPI00128B9065|nr:hypothetical protein [Proteus mirabilis]MBI6334498.1 hypothetical protein [Proteus mirabilis]MDM3727386.1 hypothetical protein [Proteus mirabilis]HEJ0267615.1 hypothetical protein [Proteus mirabilis]